MNTRTNIHGGAPPEWWNCPASDYNTDAPADCCAQVLCGKPGCAYRETGKPPADWLQAHESRPVGNGYCAFDIEIATPISGPDWKADRPLGISCAATLTSDGDLVLWHGRHDDLLQYDDTAPLPAQMPSEDVIELAGYLLDQQAQGYTLLTWNGLSFDLDVLAEETHNENWFRPIADLAMRHIDMGFLMVAQMGYMIGLETCAHGLGVGSKTEGMHGDLAPILWNFRGWAGIDAGTRVRVEALGVRPGTREAQNLCLKYVEQDVRLTAAVYEALLRQGQVYWTTAKGTRSYHPWRPKSADGRLLTVEEALALPEPDTSWMTNPRLRINYYEWTLPE